MSDFPTLLADLPAPPRGVLSHPVFTHVGAARAARDWLTYAGMYVRRCEAVPGWLVYDRDGAYSRVSDREFRAVFHLLSDRVRGEAGMKLKFADSIRGALGELAALPDVPVDVDALDARPNLLAFRYGVADLRTGALVEDDPAALLTYRVPVEFDRNAEAPRWERFVREVLPDPEVAAFVQRLVGYGITGETSEQKFALLYGSGGNGKSVFLETLAKVFGPITVTAPFSTLAPKSPGSIPNDIARLRDARLVFASESESGARLSSATVKMLTGGDRVTARFLHREFFTFSPRFLLMLATNALPAVKDQSDGFWRRVVLVPFTQSFKGDTIDPNLERDLAAELPGIAAWAVRGAVDWYENGLQVPAGLRGEVDTYRQSADRLGEFIATRLAVEPGASTKAKDVWLAYQDWLRENGEDGVLRRSLISMLSERPGLSLRFDRTRKQEYLDGCRVLTSTEVRMAEAGMSAA